MLEFLRPIVILDTWLYIFSGVFALFFLRLMWLARRDRARSIFTLERENATVRFTRAFTAFMLTLAFMLGIYYLSLVIPEIVPPPPSTPTPLAPASLPPTPTPPPLLPTPTPTPTLLPTPIATLDALPPLPGEATPTVAAPPPPPPPVNSGGQAPGCPNPQARIDQPGNGAQVDGLVQVRGAAAIDNFSYYKFEFRLPGVPEWSFINRYDNSVAEGVLGSWNSDTVEPGEYEFRLVVVDQTGNFPEPCTIRLIVQ